MFLSTTKAEKTAMVSPIVRVPVHCGWRGLGWFVNFITSIFALAALSRI